MSDQALQPPREYPDWHRLVPRRFREEVYRSVSDWVFHYNVSWESFLIYAIILHNKDYVIEGGMPHWFRAYAEHYEVVPFDCEGRDVTLVFHKENWVRNTLVFRMADGITQRGTVYNMESRIEPSAAFLAGEPAPGRAACPQSTWEAYVLRHYERLRQGIEWRPGM